ncbi:MAG: chitosanase [Pyrinomonadaceae bacterium]|nr:chitosanase [Pyrinomonadaceae bacterium]
MIDDEIIRARVREMIGGPKPAAQSRFSRISSNPLAPLIVGFILTGLIGSYFTYYYTDRQKTNDATRQAYATQLDVQRNKDAQALEFVRKQNLLEIENQQHLNAQALGTQAAKEMRDTDAARAARQKDVDYARSQMNVVEDRKLELAKVLEVFLKYVKSDDPLSRTFGYDMFVFFGHGEWAARLIALKGDPAGRDTLKNIQNNAEESASVRLMAFSGLTKISDTQLKRVLSVINIHETGRADINLASTWLTDNLIFGPKEILGELEAYLGNPQARYQQQLQPWMERVRTNAAGLRGDGAFKALLEKMATDPVMNAITEDAYRTKYLNPALQVADELGVKTVLGLGAIVDTRIHQGTSAKSFAEHVATQLGGTPRSGVDEKQWIKAFLETRLERAGNRMTARLIVKRAKFFLDQAARNNWDLLPPFEVKDTPESGG